MSQFALTIFPTLQSDTMQSTASPSFKEFCDQLSTNPPEYDSKKQMPLFCPMLFNGTTTKNGAMRHDKGVTLIYGACGDHDSGTMSLEEARQRLDKAGVEAFLYTTPSWTPELPRWRVVVPFSNPSSLPHDHLVAVEKLNYLLDGTMKSESFTLSQSFYFGKVKGVQYQTAYIPGTPIDQTYCERRGKVKLTVVGGTRAPGDSEGPTDSAELVQIILRGTEGMHEAQRTLSARMAAQGFEEQAIIDYLVGLTASSAVADTERGQARLREVTRLVTGAMEKFAPPPLARIRPTPKAKAPPDPDKPAGEAPDASGEEDELHDRITGWEPLDRASVQPPEFYIDGLLEARRSAGLVAPGGTGKTTILLDLAIATALGRPWLGMAVKQGSFVLLSLDDMQADLDGALDSLLTHHEGLTKAEVKQVLGSVRLISLTGLREAIAYAVEGERGVAATDLEERLVEALAGVPDLRCVVLDTLRQFAGGDTNNSRVMTIATKAVTGMAERLGCCTVVPHHTTKLGARSGESDQYTGSGSAAFGDNLRVILVLVTQTLDEMKETVALTPLQEAGLCMSQILKLTDTRGSLRRKTLEPIWIARNSFELRRVDGVLLSEGQRIELRMSSIADIVRAGHTSVAAIRGALKVSTAKANALVAQAIQRGFIVKGVRRGDPLTAP